jgi:hypothetical protein
MAYRDELEAANERAQALAGDLERERAEREKLQHEVEELRAKQSAEHAVDAKLEHQAQEGHRKREAAQAAEAEAKQRREEQQKDAEARERENRFELVCNPLGFANTALGFYGIGVLGMLPWGFLCAWCFESCKVQPEWTFVPALLVPVVVAGVLALIARLTRRRSAARERAWLAGLPFSVERYEDMLYHGDKAARLIFSVRYGQKAPAPSLLADLTGAVFPRSQLQGETIAVNFGSAYDSDFWGGRLLRKTFHRLVERVLLPLHAKHAMNCVRVAAERD